MGVIESQEHSSRKRFLHHIYWRHGQAKEPRRSPARAARTAPSAALYPPHASAVGQDRRAWAGVATGAHRAFPSSTGRLTPGSSRPARGGQLTRPVRPQSQRTARQHSDLLQRHHPRRSVFFAGVAAPVVDLRKRRAQRQQLSDVRWCLLSRLLVKALASGLAPARVAAHAGAWALVGVHSLFRSCSLGPNPSPKLTRYGFASACSLPRTLCRQ